MFKRLYLSSVITQILLLVESVQINVSVTKDVEGVLGNDFVPLSCSYEHDNDSTVFSIQWEKKRISGNFVVIAYFSPPRKSQTNATFADTPEGKQLSPRAELYNPTEKNRTATLRLRYVECQDDAEYRCTVIFLTTTGTQSRSDTTNLTVKGMPSKLHISMGESLQREITAGTVGSFTCSGNLGKPAGYFVWEMMHPWSGNTDVFNNVTTVSQVTPGNCTYNGTSTLALEFKSSDNMAILRCDVKQELVQPNNSYYTDTELHIYGKQFTTGYIFIGTFSVYTVVKIGIIIMFCTRWRMSQNNIETDIPDVT